MAEGWYGFKENRTSGLYQIRQTGIENLYILKAIRLIITGKESRRIKPDKKDSYQLAIVSKEEIKKVVEFFTSPNVHPLYGYKKEQFDIFINELKKRGLI